jgi:hypothetical protein
MAKPLVSGEIRFAQLPRLPADAKAHVRLSETGKADAPAQLITEQVLTNIAQQANSGQPIPFALSGNLEDERGTYTLSVLVDVDGDGKISIGDYINMQSYPVLTYGYPSEASVLVKEVN